MRRLLRRLFRAVLPAVVLIASIEGLVHAGLKHPNVITRMPSPIRGLFRGIYLDGARNIIQYEPACSRYDEGLTYTLKPGQFMFSNAEFNTAYSVNSQGIRSSEEALRSPQIVVIGDSRAMGWGVAQGELYSRILGDLAGKRSLNAAVSSFGTVREMRLLDRLDISSAETIILHYVANDYDENRHFFENGNTIRISDRTRYMDVRERYLKGKSYYPGKYTLLTFYRLGAESYNGVRRAFGVDEQPREAEYFLNALLHARRTPIDDKRLIIMGDSAFIKKVRKLIASGRYPAFLRKAVLLSDDVPISGYFTLDNHMNAKGHRLLAERLLRAVR